MQPQLRQMPPRCSRSTQRRLQPELRGADRRDVAARAAADDDRGRSSGPLAHSPARVGPPTATSRLSDRGGLVNAAGWWGALRRRAASRPLRAAPADRAGSPAPRGNRDAAVSRAVAALDALGHHGLVQLSRQGDDRGDDGVVARILAEVADERAVDLEHVERQPLQVRQRRVAGAEIVDRQPHAQAPQLVDAGCGLPRRRAPCRRSR